MSNHLKTASPTRVSDYFDMVVPTYIENWSPALWRLTMAQEDVPLTLDEARALGSNIMELGEPFADRPQEVGHVRARVAEAVTHFPAGAFVRLGSRSPKDSWSWHREGGPRILPGEDPLRHLLDVSERAAEDLQLALENGYPPHVWVRQWVDIPPWAELRLFMKGRRLVGVSQYLYRHRSDDLDREQDIVRWGLKQFFTQLREASHLDDAIFDVFPKLIRRGNEGVIEFMLIEVNPFCTMTDPCLFTWNGEGRDLDGTFRYVRKDGGEVRFRL